MPITLAPDQSAIQKALRGFLLAVLPAGTEVIEGQDNRVPEPAVDNFIAFWPLRRPRLSTNVENNIDASYVASIAAQNMTVTEIIGDSVIVIGATLFGPGVVTGTTIVSQTSGPAGKAGVYVVSEPQTVTSATLASGRSELLQPTEIRFRLDVHGPLASDNAQIISTMLRSAYGVNKFAEFSDSVVPLYSDDPQQVPFSNGEQQIEWRYMVEAVLQANQVVTIPQQFAASLEAEDINVVELIPTA